MNAIKVAGIALIVAGILALSYGGFSYTKDTQEVKLGPLEFSVKEKKDVNIPVWAGIAAIVAGGLMLVMGKKQG
jgi:drug/metabolite transporter (DMT)-like permease